MTARTAAAISRMRTPLAAALCALWLAALSPQAAGAKEADQRSGSSEDPPLVLADTEPAPPPRTFAARRVVLEPRVQREVSPAPLTDLAPLQAAELLPGSPPPAAVAWLAPLSGDPLEASIAAPSPARPERGHLGLVLGASGLEQPVHAEVALRFASGFLSARFGGGLLPGGVGAAMLSAVSVPGGALTSWSAEAGLALHPFRGSFFLGATVGHLALSASAPTRLGTVTIEANTLYLTPRLGWLAVWDSGFTLCFEAGAQLPFGPAVNVGGPPKAAANAESLARSIAALPLPTAAVKFGLLL